MEIYISWVCIVQLICLGIWRCNCILWNDSIKCYRRTLQCMVTILLSAVSCDFAHASSLSCLTACASVHFTTASHYWYCSISCLLLIALGSKSAWKVSLEDMALTLSTCVVISKSEEISNPVLWSSWMWFENLIFVSLRGSKGPSLAQPRCRVYEKCMSSPSHWLLLFFDAWTFNALLRTLMDDARQGREHK